ncbi:PREDICTED: protein SHQ1 homolog isoform X1 [Myotis brandtii]|uniref:protein SHQ1 homolog isoform X1 n=1 Tax=Myotis brandtii TaxID=109478 RepID=UPI0003BBD4E7|nr:PREDICTED: protein SHQ1 homolog isoform X1 [Myotis brandtii]
MLTPAFDLSQDPDFLTVAIRVPHARVSEFDVYFQGVDFRFYAKPYFLRLTLPGRIVENGSEKGSYDADKGIFTIQLPKETPGQHFEGLNMLTTLLAPRKSRTAKPLVEEIGASEVSEEGVEDDDEDFDWEIEQSPYEEVSEGALHPQGHYGFGGLRSGVFQRLQKPPGVQRSLGERCPQREGRTQHRKPWWLPSVLQTQNPQPWTLLTRLQSTLPSLCWSPRMNSVTSLILRIQILLLQLNTGRNAWLLSWPNLILIIILSFSEEEKCQLRKFVHKSYLLDKRAQRQVYYSLIDILLAYCYETRVNEGERNVESAWNIRKLSPTLCWFETWTNVHEVLVSFGRRVLCYPLYRHFKLVTKACRDTIMILQLGKSAVLKCLLDIHKIFQESDQAYILNDLYISDYCVWIQKAKSTRLAALAEALKKAPLTKAQLGLEVNELEAAALLVCEEEAACPASRPTPPSSSEASGSEDSDSSTSSAGTADPDSEPEGLAGRGTGRGRSLQGPVLDESRALRVDGHGLCGRLAVPRADACRGELLASARAPVGAGPLIEELGEQLETVVQLSEPEGPAPGPRRAQADGTLPGTGGEGSICG